VPEEQWRPKGGLLLFVAVKIRPWRFCVPGTDSVGEKWAYLEVSEHGTLPVPFLFCSMFPFAELAVGLGSLGFVRFIGLVEGYVWYCFGSGKEGKRVFVIGEGEPFIPLSHRIDRHGPVMDG